ncbi:hypothetical protein KBD20_01045 [Candidatus Saccharibacteria bacterium]|nr:hypothetical protein [Candidatus Saccharibacteria bacterium]
MKRKFTGAIALLVTVVLVGLVVLNAQYVRDWAVVQATDVQPAAAVLEDSISLTDAGSFTYEASLPEVLGADTFNAACGNVAKEQSVVLGCYTRQRFYVYDVTDPRLNGVQEVTAAHELLHAMYERLSQSERDKLDRQLITAAAAIQDEQFKATVDAYKVLEPNEISNELHSILGTEIAVLPQALEDHYARYFKDRSKIVRYTQGYQEQFVSIENQIKSYDQQLAALKQQIEATEATISRLESQLNSDQQQMSVLRRTDVAAYNAMVPAYNQTVKEYNVAVTTAQQLTSEYNDIVASRNELAATQTELTNQLDSNYQTR